MRSIGIYERFLPEPDAMMPFSASHVVNRDFELGVMIWRIAYKPFQKPPCITRPDTRTQRLLCKALAVLTDRGVYVIMPL